MTDANMSRPRHRASIEVRWPVQLIRSPPWAQITGTVRPRTSSPRPASKRASSTSQERLNVSSPAPSPSDGRVGIHRPEFHRSRSGWSLCNHRPFTQSRRVFTPPNVARLRRYRRRRARLRLVGPTKREDLWKSWQSGGRPDRGREAVTFHPANTMR